DKALTIGISNTGKSSLVNRLAEHTTLVSPLPGTTLGILKRKLKNARFYIYDTPGIMTKDRAIDLLSVECQYKIAKSNRLTRKTFKIDQKRAILVGGMAYITVDYEGNLKPIFQLFTYENVVLHETNINKAKELWKKRKGDFLVPPCKKEELNGITFKESNFNMEEEKELVMPGLFWINVKRGPFKIKIYHPENVPLKLRDRLIKPKR
ncbi:MAG: 50S ribosome-binding GTPase, partial [Thermotogaceae bacterium]|nr:50S ribosome-binding GTPase [Thermotogaceae bacterium]